MDDAKIVNCTQCGQPMRRAYFTPPMIAGDTVSGGCSYQYYDHAMGCYVDGKSDRAEKMKKLGLEEYTPDPEMKRQRDEIRYIKKHATKEEIRVAKQEVKKIGKKAERKRREKIVKSHLSQVKLD